MNEEAKKVLDEIVYMDEVIRIHENDLKHLKDKKRELESLLSRLMR